MPRFDESTGRYIYLTIDDLEYRVYFEESGAGIPLRELALQFFVRDPYAPLA